jgi:hypothetical protein
MILIPVLMGLIQRLRRRRNRPGSAAAEAGQP